MYVKPSSRCRYSIVHLLPTSSSKSAPVPSAFYDFWGKVELSLVSCTFCRPHLPKVLRDRLFFTIFVKLSSRYSLVHLLPTSSWCSRPLEIELSLQSCVHFVDHFPRSSRGTAETETLLWRPQQPLYPKKYRVSRPRVFSSLNSHVPDLSPFPTTSMMMWLP